MMTKGRWVEHSVGEVAVVDPEGLVSTTKPDEVLDYISLEDVSQGNLLSSSRVPFRQAPSRARRIVRENDVLFGTVRPNLQSHLLYRGGLARPIASTGFAVVRVTPDRADPRFIFEFIMSHLATVQVNRIIAGSNYPAVSSGDVRSLRLDLPLVREQAALATVLEDASSVITTLERLIVKKEEIKQGIMQQLLTGKIRLPSFTAPLVQTNAGAVGSFRGGSGFPLRFQGAATGEYPFFKVSDMSAPGNELFMRAARHHVSEAQRKQIGAARFPKDAIVFAKVGAAVFLERKRILRQPSCIDNNMAALVVDKTRADVRFVHYALTAFPMSSLVATTALPSLNGGQLRSIPLLLPTDLAEQRAIAAVLEDADSDIRVLRDRLGKAKAIKQGMTQELLTGRTRLPVMETAAA